VVKVKRKAIFQRTVGGVSVKNIKLQQSETQIYNQGCRQN
jgi:hypothetical protein